MKGRISSWSFSFAQVFRECKYRAKLQKLDKVPDLQPKTAADRGTAIHQEAEDYVVGKAPSTTNLRHFTTDLTALQRHHAEGRVVCEQEWGFDRDWNVAPWKSAWLRLKCDAVCHLDATHAAVIDYKTGKRFGNELKHAEQLQLYALTSLIRFPEVQKVTCELWYFDQNELASFDMKRSQLTKYLRQFDRIGREITEETEFKPNPNVHSCRYCPYGPAKQGDCIYGVDPNAPINAPKPLTFKPFKATSTAMDDLMAAELKGL